jgi:hypothetical protein
MNKSDAELVILQDNPDIEHYGNLTLDISEDNYVYYEDNTGLMEFSQPRNNFALRFEGYIGKIYIPKNTVLEIHTSRDIYGRIASPAVIFSDDGTINLDIIPKAKLELCLETAGEFIINGKNMFPDKGDDEKICCGYYIDDLLKKYVVYQERILKSMFDLDPDAMAEYPQKPSRYYYDTCYAYNAVMIRKKSGVTDLRYNENDRNINQILILPRENIRFLSRALRKSVIEEDYETASVLYKKICFFNDTIKSLNAKILYANESIPVKR